MMTYMFMNIIMIYFMMILIKNSNPVKMSMILMMLSGMIFLKIYMKTSLAWFPMLFFLIFMGGILVMFMILSSILPNELPKETNIKTMFLIVLMLFLPNWSVEKKEFMSNMILNLKNFLETSHTMFFLMALMMSYFFMTISMLSSEEKSIRTILCWKKKLIL